MRRPLSVFVLLLLVAALGCGSRDAEFRANELALTQHEIAPAHREQIAAVLRELFGTPDEPRLPGGDLGLAKLLSLERLEQAAGPVASHEPGQTVGLYRRHCAQCHGVTGDAQGPASLYQNPYPRDFRQGVFHYKSTYRGDPPTDADLHDVLLRGAPGTAMPSFVLLTDEERAALVDYIKYLAIRGQLEQALARYAADELDFDPMTGDVAPGSELSLDDDETREIVLAELLAPIVDRWASAPQRVVPASEDALPAAPQEFAHWVAEGRALFHDVQRANCVKCHGQEGAGGVELVDRDDWNAARQEFAEETARLAASLETLQSRIAGEPPARRTLLEAELRAKRARLTERRQIVATMPPPRVAVPRTLSGGRLRGGAEPQDVFRRVHQGIAGTPMPAVGPAGPAGQGALSDEEVWRLAAYVLSLTGNLSATEATLQ